MKAVNLIFFPTGIPEDVVMAWEMDLNAKCREVLGREGIDLHSFFFPIPEFDILESSAVSRHRLLAHCEIPESAHDKMQEYTQLLASRLAEYARQSMPGERKNRPECRTISIAVCVNAPKPDPLLLYLVKDKKDIWHEHWSDESSMHIHEPIV